MKKNGIILALLLGALINVFAGDGVVLYGQRSSNGRFREIYIDALDENGNPGQDGIEDTILMLTGSTIDEAIYRRVKPTEGIPPVRVKFNDRLTERGFDGFYRMLSDALETIDGKPARPNQGR